MKTLWIAEKRSLAEAVGKVLGSAESAWDSKGLTHNQVGDHSFVWLDGHAFEQAMPDHYLPDDVPLTKSGNKVWRKEDLPIIPQEWTILPKRDKQRRLDKLAELLTTCAVVHHLGDPDAEGQVLVDEALSFYGYTGPVKRVCVNDYNESKVKQALAGIRDNGEPLFRGWYQWGLARSRYDWLLGLNCTRAMTLRGRALGHDGVLSVGSVQTPLLYIIRERDRAIEEFKAVPYFFVSANIVHANGSFKANWKARDGQLGLDESKRLTDKGIADALVARLTGKPAMITGYAKTPKEKKVPLPLGMDELQIDAFKKYGHDAAAVLAAAQTLYEVYKVMSYPRSTIRHLSEAQHAGAADVVAAVFQVRPDLAALKPLLDMKRKSEAFDDKKVAGTPHHGIVPAVPEVPINPERWTEIERDIYELVARSYLAQFATPYEYLATGIEVTVDGERFVANGTTPVSAGWKAIYAEIEDKEKPEGDDKSKGQKLPAMSNGDDALCAKCEHESKKTSPPDRFDDGLISEALRDAYKFVTDEKARNRLKEQEDGTSGIGTSATRSAIVKDLKERALIVPLKAGSKKLMTSPAARALIDALPLDVKDPATAGLFKTQLDQVSKGGDSAFRAFMAQTEQWVTSIVNKAADMPMTLPRAAGVLICPTCKAGQVRRKEGEKGAYWYCVNWNREPEKCEAKYQDVRGKPLLEPIGCPCCKTGQLRFKLGEKAAFWFCSNWNAEVKCESRFDDRLGKPDLTPKPKCPICREGELRSIVGENGKFWGCSRYRDGCKASFPDKLGKPDFAPKPTYKCPKCKVGLLNSIPGPKGRFWGCGRFKEGCKATYPDKLGKPDLFAKAKH
jgi:DNA topoisomerase-3